MKSKRKEEERLYTLMENRGLLPGREGRASPSHDPDLEQFIHECKSAYPETFRPAGRSGAGISTFFRPAWVAAALLMIVIGGIVFAYRDTIHKEALRLVRETGPERTGRPEEEKPEEDLFEEPLRKMEHTRERTDLAGRAAAPPEGAPEKAREREKGVTAERKLEGLWDTLEAPEGEGETSGKIVLFALTPMEGVDRRTCDRISDFLKREARAEGEVVHAPECTTTACRAGAAKARGGEMAVSGSISRSDGGCKISLEIIDAWRGSIENRATITSGCGGEELLTSAGRALVVLLEGVNDKEK